MLMQILLRMLTRVDIPQRMTSAFISNSMRANFNIGSNISDAFNNSKQTHQAWIDIWGSESNYVEAHGMFGIEMSREFGMDRTLISATTDIEVAKYFGNTIYEIKVPRANVLFQTIEGVGEKEVLIRICADKIKKIT